MQGPLAYCGLCGEKADSADPRPFHVFVVLISPLQKTAMFETIRAQAISTTALTLIVVWPLTAAQAQDASLASLQTRAERTNYEEGLLYPRSLG